jgi:hypothetical protein
LRAGVEGGEGFLQLAGAPGEAIHLLGKVGLEGGAGAAEPEVRPQSADGGDEREHRAGEDRDQEQGAHLEATVPRSSVALQSVNGW